MELLDIYDEFGKKTGRTIVRGDKSVTLNDNEHIPVAIVYIENSNGEFLIQKTSLEKGGNYSSTGGHIESGSDPLSTIVREIKEELNVDVLSDELESLGYIICGRPICYMFYLKKDLDIKDINVQVEEVEYVKYMNKDEILELINDELITKSHGMVFKKILELKNK